MTIELEKNMFLYDQVPQSKAAIFTEIETDILRFIHEFGFCHIKQIMKRFGMGRSRAYFHMKMLTRLGLVNHVKIMQDKHGAYYLTHKAINLIGLDLPLIRQIPLNVYVHQLTVVDVYLKLRELHAESTWISERRLNRENNSKGFKINDHLPDGVMVLANGTQYAVEIERSIKAKKRLEEILLGYSLQVKFKEAWYFCTTEVFSLIKKIANDVSNIKTYNLKDFLV